MKYVKIDMENDKMHPIEKKINRWLTKLNRSPDNLSSRNLENIKIIKLVLTRLLRKPPTSTTQCNCRINKTFVIDYTPDGSPHELYCRKHSHAVVT